MTLTHSLRAPAMVHVRADRSAALYALVVAYPVLWLTGLAYVAVPALVLCLAIPLLYARPVRVPPGFGIWLAFLACMLLSGIEADTPLRVALFGWRASFYVGAAVLFLWIVNLDGELFAERSVVLPLVLLWVECVAGGWLGVLLPAVSFRSPLEHLLPASVLSNSTAGAYVHPAFTDLAQRTLGFRLARPKTLFAYTNQWGATVGLLTPFVFATMHLVRGRVVRLALGAALVASVIPIVVSANRGLWFALIVGGGYYAARMAAREGVRILAVGAVAVIAVGLLLAVTPAGHIAVARLTSQSNSNGTRASLFREAIDGISASPLLGYGSPRPSTTTLGNAHTGTQGQLSLVLYSHGIPALIFYLGFFVFTLIHTARRPARGDPRGQRDLLLSTVIVISMVVMFVYDFIPLALYVLMAACALLWRGRMRGAGR
jgi:polysaccharide biosynthesis protein PslJ